MALVIVQDKNFVFKISKKYNPFKLMEDSLRLVKTIFFENTSNVAQIYNNFGAVFLSNGKYDCAIFYHEKSYGIRLKLYESSNDFSLIWVNLPVINLIRCYYEMEDYKKSLDVTLKVFNELSQANLLTNEILMTMQLKENLMKCFFKLKDFNKAKEFYEDLIQTLENSSTKKIGKYDFEMVKKLWDRLNSNENAHE